MGAPDDKSGYVGHQVPTSSGSAHNSERLHIESVMDERRTMMPVRIVKVYGGGVGPAPTADVQPLVDQVDGLGNRTPHATVFGVSVGRVHSGSGAIISDPAVGDTYMMAVADRDISSLKATGQQSAPGSKRRGSPSDGVLHHAMLSGTPDQYVYFKPGGGFVVADRTGNMVESDGKTVMVVPASGGTVILGGTGSDGGTYSPVQTVAGPSSIVKARV